MNKILTIAARNELIKQHRHERDKKVCDRIKAVLAYDDGYSCSEIAKFLLLEDTTVGRHIEDYLRENKLSLESGGSDSKLSTHETKELCKHLSEITYLYVKDICTYVWKQYHKKYSISGMTKWLHAQGFCYKKAHAVPAKADREQQKKFVSYYIPITLQNAGIGECKI